MALLQIWDYLLRMLIQQTTLEARDRASPHDLWERESEEKFTQAAVL